MDVERRGTAQSLRVQLSLWMAGLMLVIGSVATTASYRFAMGEAHALQDDTLRQIGALIGRVPTSAIRQMANPRRLPFDASVEIIELPVGTSFEKCDRSTDPGCGVKDGLQDLPQHGEKWRAWIGSQASGFRFAVAQPTALRDEIARDGSLRTLVPMLCLIVGLVPLVAWIIRRRLQPIIRLASMLDGTDEHAIARLPTHDVPREIVPFVTSINRLLARLRLALENQRRFVADAAHELRTPLTALTLQAQNLEGFSMEPAMRERFDALRQGINRSSRLVAQLLSLARLQQRAPVPTNKISVKDVVSDVIAEAFTFAESKKTDLGAERLDAVIVNADRLALHTVLRNLIDNAIRYTPEEGRVDIRAYYETGFVIIEVQDNGPGMSQADREKACEPFFRAGDGSESGSGLGLAIARDMAHAMGGEIQLLAPDHGLLVRLRIPVEVESA